MIYAYHTPPLSNPHFDKFTYHGPTNRGSRSINLLKPGEEFDEKILNAPGVKYFDVTMKNVSFRIFTPSF